MQPGLTGAPAAVAFRRDRQAACGVCVTYVAIVLLSVWATPAWRAAVAPYAPRGLLDDDGVFAPSSSSSSSTSPAAAAAITRPSQHWDAILADRDGRFASAGADSGAARDAVLRWLCPDGAGAAGAAAARPRVLERPEQLVQGVDALSWYGRTFDAVPELVTELEMTWPAGFMHVVVLHVLPNGRWSAYQAFTSAYALPDWMGARQRPHMDAAAVRTLAVQLGTVMQGRRVAGPEAYDDAFAAAFDVYPSTVRARGFDADAAPRVTSRLACLRGDAAQAVEEVGRRFAQLLMRMAEATGVPRTVEDRTVTLDDVEAEVDQWVPHASASATLKIVTEDADGRVTESVMSAGNAARDDDDDDAGDGDARRASRRR